jgi:hypothetical protein
MARRDTQAPMRARIHADVERQDVLLFGFTFHQLVILTVTGLILYAAWTALATVIHPALFPAGAVPVAGAAFALAVGRRDGIALDTWVWHAVRHRRAPHHLITADQTTAPAPAWIHTSTPVVLPAPLRLPARGITAEGLIDLGPDGTTALASASTVAFGLRTAAEQNGLVAGFGRWLNSLDAPVQILVRAQHIDLASLADWIHDQAPGLPHPALEQAALSHVAFLDELAAGRELLHRQVTIAVRDTRSPAHTLHRATQTGRALAACEVTARLHQPAETAAVIRQALDPDTPPSTVEPTPASTVIRAASTERGYR